MHSRVNICHSSEIGDDRNIVIKKKQDNLAELALVLEVMINIIHIACIFSICL